MKTKTRKKRPKVEIVFTVSHENISPLCVGTGSPDIDLTTLAEIPEAERTKMAANDVRQDRDRLTQAIRQQTRAGLWLIGMAQDQDYRNAEIIRKQRKAD